MDDPISNPIHYYLIRDSKIGNLDADFKKITDYLLTFVGEVGIKTIEEGSVLISYSGIPLKATLETKINPKALETVIPQQITLTCEKDDNLSVNLIKNVTKNIGYRIFNPQTKSYLVINPNLIDLTTARIDKKFIETINRYHLTPLFQLQNTLIFYAKDKSERIHLINRHLLEYLTENQGYYVKKSDFSVVVAKDIGRFVALFDRGLIPSSYYQYKNILKNIINLSGFNINKIDCDLILHPIYFMMDNKNQNFNQIENMSLPQKINLNVNSSFNGFVGKIAKTLKKDILAIKIDQEIGYIAKGKDLIPKLNVLIFLDSKQ